MQSTPAPVPRPAEIVRVVDRQALVAASGDDVFVRCSVPLAEPVRAWAIGTDVAWFLASRRRRGAGWLTVAADPRVAPALVDVAAEELGSELSGVTVPAAALPLVADDLRPTEFNLWDWFSTATPPPRQPGEDAVSWAGPGDEAGIVALIDNDSPRHSARPGDSDVLRWCVIRADDDVLACAALVEHVPGVAHLASIVTRTDQRGRGLGRAVTAWITRRLLEDGRPVVTLGMYADNDVARRLYRDLGYVDEHHFASGYLPGRRAPGDADPVHDEAD